MAKKKKKLPPPKKKKKGKKKKADKKRQPVAKTISVEVPAIVVGPEEESSLTRVRWSAAHYYASNLDGVSIRDMAEHPAFGIVSKSTIERWSREDKWLERRRDMQERIRVQVEGAISTDIARQRSEQLLTLQTIFVDAVSKLIPKGKKGQIPEVKSYEGLVNAVTRLAETLDSHRERLGETIIPQMFTPSADEAVDVKSITVKPQLTPDEARAAAKLMIKMRREEISRRQQEMDDADGLVVDAVLGEK